MNCKCRTCKNACTFRPGWFKPLEIARAAKFRNFTEKEFFDRYLVVDYFFQENEEPIFLIGPAIVGVEPGGMAPFDMRGTCTFFTQDELCNIHHVKPFECVTYIHGLSEEESYKLREDCVAAWNNPEAQAMIVRLLGYQPEVPEITLIDMIRMTR